MTTTLIFILGLILSVLGFGGMLNQSRTEGWALFVLYLLLSIIGGSVLIAGIVRFILWMVSL